MSEENAFTSPAIDRVKGGRWVTIWVRDEMEATEVVLREQNERMAAVRIVRAPYRSVVVFGTVLPWRADTRHAEYRGARVFEHTLREHAKEWDAQMTGEEDTELCIAGDFNQEFQANGPVGTRIGRAALDEILQNSKLTCATGGSQDPLVHRRCGTNIDHILISKGLRVSDVLPESWPESIPVPRRISDHYGISITVADA